MARSIGRHNTSSIGHRAYGFSYRALLRRNARRVTMRTVADALPPETPAVLPIKSPEEWMQVTKVRVLGPDGWRKDGKNWDTPISEEEFHLRVSTSSCIFPAGYWQQNQDSRGGA